MDSAPTPLPCPSWTATHFLPPVFLAGVLAGVLLSSVVGDNTALAEALAARVAPILAAQVTSVVTAQTAGLVLVAKQAATSQAAQIAAPLTQASQDIGRAVSKATAPGASVPGRLKNLLR